MFRPHSCCGSSRSFSGKAFAAGALLLTLLTEPSGAADVVFPPGSRVGIAPPGQMQPSRSFQGFEDRDRDGAILIVEFPGTAYAEFEKMMTNETLGKQGLVVEKREPL